MQNKEDFFKKAVNNEKFQKNKLLGGLHKRLTERSPEEVARRARDMLSFFGIFLLGVILSCRELPFSVYPLGIPLICGVGRFYLAAAIGSVVGGIASGVGREYIFAYVAVFIIRFLMAMPFAIKKLPSHRELLFRPEEISGELDGSRGGALNKIKTVIYRIFSIREEEPGKVFSRERIESIGFKLIIAAVGGFVAGLFLLIQTDFSYYSLACMAFMMIICPTLTLTLTGLFDPRAQMGGLAMTVSVASAMILCSYASMPITVLEISLTPFFALLFTLVAGKLRGLPSALFIAISCGLCLDIRYVPMLMLSAVAYVLLCDIKLSASMATVAGICLVWCYLFSDVLAFISIVPSVMLAIPTFLVFHKFIKGGENRQRIVWHENKYFAKSISEESKNLAVRARVASLSDGFSSLSQAVNSLSDKFRRPDTLNLRRMTDEGFESVCEGCPNHAVCFGAEYDRTVAASGSITSALHKRGYVEEGDLNEDFLSVCVRKRKLIERMNALCAESTESIIRNQKLGFFASSYDDIRDILQDAIEADSDEYECDTVTGGKIYDYLKSEGYDAEGVVVCGKRCKRVMLKGVTIKGDSQSESAALLCKSISEIVGVRMTGPVFEVGEDGMLMLFSAKPRLRTVCASGRFAAFECGAEESREVAPFEESVKDKRAELCGDVTSSFLTDTSYFYSLISDGMGSGEEAAFSSGLCSMFCEKMLMAGNRADITIRMLNNFLRGENSQRGSECSVTVDLFELDLMLGVASFIKSGAAPTYVLRGGEVYKVASKTMPVGIIKNPDIKVTRFDMKSGDLVLMMSDGVCGEGDECEWIIEALCEARLPESPAATLHEGERFASALRDKIFGIAKEKMKQAGRFDDVSLSVVLVM